jgi:cell wall assembly regulator SMI1
VARRSVEAEFPQATQRLDGLLLENEQQFAESLNAGATDRDIEALRVAIQPYELPAEVEMLYRWHNGQKESQPPVWWPLLEAGPLLNTEQASTEREQLSRICKEPFQWSEAWLPITHEGWAQVAVKLDEPLQGLVIDAGFPDEPSVKAQSLAAVVQAIARLIEAGVPLYSTAEDGRHEQEWVDERNRVLTTRRQPVMQWHFPAVE